MTAIPDDPRTHAKRCIVRIRRAVPTDRDSIYEIAISTGDNGSDASGLHRHPDLIGDVYAGPYLEYPGSQCFVLADESDRARGYVLGVSDTEAFEDWLDEQWWPQLRTRVDDLDTPTSADIDVIGRIGHRSSRTIIEGFPAHGHINVLADAQGSGHGRLLMNTVMEALAYEAPAMHLEVGRGNPRALAFYERMGFARILDNQESVFVGRRLRRP